MGLYARVVDSWHDRPVLDTPVLSGVLEAYEQAHLATNNDASVLVWNGTDYIPTSLKATVGKPRLFFGTRDPLTVSGVSLDAKCVWLPPS